MPSSWRKSSYSKANHNCVEVGMNWRTSSRCEAGACAEVGQDGPAILIRDTMDRGGPVLAVSTSAWAVFTGTVKHARS